MNRTQDEFEKEWLNPFPHQTLLSWLEELVDQLDCPPPEVPSIQNDISYEEYFKRLGAFETQMIILGRLKYAIKMEKNKLHSVDETIIS